MGILTMRIEKREDEIKAAYWNRFAQLHPVSEYFVTQHQDVRKSGYPDNMLHGYGHSTSWEFKHATPNFSSPGIQELTCLRLAQRSYCRYVIFYECRELLRTLIIHPRQLQGKGGKIIGVSFEVAFDGFAFDELAKFMHIIHVGKTMEQASSVFAAEQQ